MSFIKVISKEEAQGELKEHYEALMAPRNGRLPPVLQCMSLHPDAMMAVSALNEKISFGGSSLSRVQEEMIATTVSVLNHCDY